MMTNIGAVALSPTSPADQEVVLWQTLCSLMNAAMDSLSAGQALPLLEVSRQVRLTTTELTALSAQTGHLPWTSEAREERRRLLVELGRQRAFCHAMLRRWRRSIALREHLLSLQTGEPAPYTESREAGS